MNQNNSKTNDNSNKNGGSGKSMWGKLLYTALAVIVAAVARKIPDFTGEQWNSLKNWWDGKCIAIIGPTASGKNSLFNKLQGMEAPSTHVQTRGAEKVDTFNFYWPLPNKEKVKFKCKRSINVGGEIDERERFWIESCSDADVIFYLVDIEKLLDDDKSTIDRIKSDVKWMSSNISGMKSDGCIQVIINKIDKMTTSSDPIEGLQKIESDISLHVDKLEEIFKKILGANFSKISGISPISMIDDHLFNRYFTHAMQDVFTSRTGKK